MLARPYQHQRGAFMPSQTITHVSAETIIKPLRDQIIVEPLERQWSEILIIINECKPLRGIIRAVGPGTYPKRYDHPEKHKRSKMWDSKRFQPTEVMIGMEIELGGAEIGGYSFESFYWGDKLHLVCREQDIVGIHD